MSLIDELDETLAHLPPDQARRLLYLMEQILNDAHDDHPGDGYPAAWGFLQVAVAWRATGQRPWPTTPVGSADPLVLLTGAAAGNPLADLADAVWEGE